MRFNTLYIVGGLLVAMPIFATAQDEGPQSDSKEEALARHEMTLEEVAQNSS